MKVEVLVCSTHSLLWFVLKAVNGMHAVKLNANRVVVGNIPWIRPVYESGV